MIKKSSASWLYICEGEEEEGRTVWTRCAPVGVYLVGCIDADGLQVYRALTTTTKKEENKNIYKYIWTTFTNGKDQPMVYSSSSSTSSSPSPLLLLSFSSPSPLLLLLLLVSFHFTNRRAKEGTWMQGGKKERKSAWGVKERLFSGHQPVLASKPS